MLYHALQQYLHAIHVVIKVFQRLLHAFAHQGVGRKMNDRLNLVLGENLVQHRRIPDITLIKLRCRVQGTAMACLQIVNNDNLLTLLNQLMHRMGTDVTGAAAY